MPQQKLTNVRFLNGGFCTQNIYLSGGPSFGFRRFQAVFVCFEHPEHGACLIDTGYGPDVYSATRQFPWRILNWFTPIPADQPFAQPNYLDSQDISPTNIKQIFVSHFHPDHIGGIKLFPQSKFVYRSQSLDELNQLSNLKKLKNVFLPDLLPDDFLERGIPVAEESFTVQSGQLNSFRTLDYWGDQSLILIDLPGHARGHTGYLLNTNSGRVLYVVDAFWDHRLFNNQRQLPWVSRQVHYSYQQYWNTSKLLFELVQQTGLTPLACHCPQTQDHVS